MSESTPERGGGGGGGGSFFSRKLGPLPTWGWMAIVGVLVLVYAYYKKSKSASAATTQTAATNNTPGGVDSSLVPQFINQTYTETTPPPAPNITTNTVNSNDTNSNNTAPTDVTIPPIASMPPPTAKPPAPRPAPLASPIFNGTYKVKKGQTLAQIATQFGITREQLAHANGLGTGAGLRTGQVLHVPNPAPKGVPGKPQ